MRKRNCRVEVCFTKDELSALSKKAKKAGMSIGGFIRHSVANKEVKEAPPADVPYLIRAMRQAGYNLDQTLKRFNSTKEIFIFSAPKVILWSMPVSKRMICL